MQRAIVLALVLVHSAPCWCRKLPERFGDVLHAHHETVDEDLRSAGEDRRNEESESIEPSVERFGLLPTPNIASPAMGTIVLPAEGQIDNIQTNINPNIVSSFRKTPKAFFAIETQNSAPGSPMDRHSASVTVVSRDKPKSQKTNKHYKTKPVDDGGLWTKFPSKTHLVEIVPIKHKSNTKTKALAYLVPKSHSVKKKLKKQKRVSGILIDRHIPVVSEKLEIGFENSKSHSFEHISSDSTSVEPKSSESGDDQAEIKDADFREDTDTSAYNDEGESTSEQKINKKINDIVSYFKENKDDSLDSLIHDVLPDDEVDPEYHVHYIIHKKPHPHHKHHSDEDGSQDNGHHVVNINYAPDDVDSKHNEINIYPQHENHNSIHELEHEHYPHHHHHIKHISSNSNENHFHSSHNTNEHVEYLPNNHEHHDIRDVLHHHTSTTTHHTTPSTQDDNEPVQHNQSFEDINNTNINDDEIISSQSLEQLHEGTSGHDLNQHKEIGNLHHEINVSEDPLLHEIHEHASKSDESNSSDESDEDPSSENYSDSSSDDTTSADLDTDQSISNVSDLKPADSSDSNGSSALSNSASDSEDHSLSSDENYSESNADYEEPFVITDDGYILGNDYENPIINIHEHDFQDPPIANIDQFIHGHGLIDAASQESASDSLESDSSPEDSEFTVNGLPHSIMFPDCKTLKKKLVKKGDEHHKSYTLTFLFNK